MRRRRSRWKAWPPRTPHPKHCLCGGTAMLSAQPVAGADGKPLAVSKPCPGIRKGQPPPPEPERQRAAAGDAGDQP